MIKNCLRSNFLGFRASQPSSFDQIISEWFSNFVSPQKMQWCPLSMMALVSVYWVQWSHPSLLAATMTEEGSSCQYWVSSAIGNNSSKGWQRLTEVFDIRPRRVSVHLFPAKGNWKDWLYTQKCMVFFSDKPNGLFFRIHIDICALFEVV